MVAQDSIHTLIQNYKKLGEADQRILQVLSVIFQPVTQADFKKVLKELGWVSESGQLLVDRINSLQKMQWFDAGLIIEVEDCVKCSPLIEEVLTRKVEADGVLSEVVNAAERAIPARPYRDFGGYVTTQGSDDRCLRNALYQNDVAVVHSELCVDEPFEAADFTVAMPLVVMCSTPFEPKWFSQRDIAIQYQVLNTYLTYGTSSISPHISTYYDVVEALFSEGKVTHPNFLSLLLEQRLLRGAVDDVESLLVGVDLIKGLGMLTWLRFLQGRTDEAITSYQLGLKAYRKATRKRSVYITGLPAIFYVLALIKSGTAEHKKEALKCIQFVSQDYDEGDSYIQSVELLQEVLMVLEGKAKASEGYQLQIELQRDTPFFSLLQASACYWLGEEVCATQIDMLVECCHAAFAEKWYWYAYESAALLQRLDKADLCEEVLAQSQEAAFVPRFVDLVEPTSSWEIALGALQDICQKEPDTAGKTDEVSETRIVWMVEKDAYSGHCELAPRQQKRKKNGQWTKGRAVALSRLYQERDQIEDLTDDDKAICEAIREEVGYGYYGRSSYYLDAEKAFAAAVDHPNLYWADRPSTRVEIQRGEPELMVLQDGKKITLQLSPIPNLDEPHEGMLRHSMVQQEGPNRLRIIDFNRQHLHIFTIVGHKGLTVPLKAKAQVLDSIAAVAPLLTIHSDIGGGENSSIDVVDADPRLHIHLQAVGDGLKAECYIQPFSGGGPLFRPGEGGATVFAEIEGKRFQTNRDIPLEAANRAELWEKCPALGDDQGEWLLDDPELALEVLLQLQEMQESLVLSWPKGKKIRLSREISKDQFHVTVGKKRDWFELGGELTMDDGDVIAMGQLMALMEKSSGRFLHLENGEVLALTRDLQHRLDAMRRFSDDDGVFHPLASHAIDELTEGMDVRENPVWQQQIERINQAQDLQPVIPSTLQAELREYQVEGFSWLARIAHWGAGACLADDMGLGKTIQALALMLTRAPDGPALVLAPTSVCMNWMDEIARFAPTLKPVYFGGLLGADNRQQCLSNVGAFDLVVCTYGLLQSEAEAFAGVQWHTIVADEAQAIKNPATKRSKAAMALQGDFKMVTTGTPIENHLGELWNIFRFINPGLLGSLESFGQLFSGPIENDNDAEARQHLKKLIRPFILRRLKSDVLTELPSRTEITLRVQPSEEESVMYETLRRQAMDRLTQSEENAGQQHIRVLAEITRLRLACCNPELVLPDAGIESEKLKAFEAVLDELLENRHKALVFSQFVGHLSLIRALLDAKGIHYQYLDGSTPAKKRKQAVNDFQAGKGDVFLISLKAGGSGLNLTAADYVLHMDPWWNPAVEDQASDRAHRMGQQRPVTIYRFVMKDTIEDKIVDLHQHKRDLANSLLEGSEMSGKMSVGDMLHLISEED